MARGVRLPRAAGRPPRFLRTGHRRATSLSEAHLHPARRNAGHTLGREAEGVLPMLLSIGHRGACERKGDQAQLPDGAFLDVCWHSDDFQPARRLARRAPAEGKKKRTADVSSPLSGYPPARVVPGRSNRSFWAAGGRGRGGRPPPPRPPRAAPQCPHLPRRAGAFGSSGGGWQPRSIRYLANASRSRSGWNGSVPSLRSCATRSRS